MTMSITSNAIRQDEDHSRVLTCCRYLMLTIPALLVLGSAPADIAASLIAILFLWRSYHHHDWGWIKTPWFMMAMLLWAMLMVMSLFAYDIGQAYEKAIPWPRLLLFAAALEHWLLNRVWLRRLIWSTAATLGLVALDTLWQQFTGTDILGHARPGTDRLNGPFHRPKVGIFLAKFYFPAVLGILALPQASRYKKASLWAPILAVLLAILLIITVFLSGERMALILVLLGLVISGILFRGMYRKILVTLLIAGLLTASAFAIFKHEVVARQLDSTLTTLEHFKESPYGQLWRSSLHLTRQYPWTGLGMRNFKMACDDPALALPKTVALRCGTHSHNIYIEWLTEGGIIGLTGFLILVGLWCRRLWQGWKITAQQANLAGPGIAVVLILWPIATTGSFFTNWNEVLFWLLLGWAMAASKDTATPQPNRLA